MNIITGIDIVEIAEFHKQMEKGGEVFIDTCFFPSESDNAPVNSLAGIFAAKEAVMKALSMGPGKWKNIMVKKDKNGRPYIELLEKTIPIESCDVSISHSESYAVAHFVAFTI